MVVQASGEWKAQRREMEWARWEGAKTITREETILFYPLNPVYKEMLESPLDEADLVRRIDERIGCYLSGAEEKVSHGALRRLNPREEVFIILLPLASVGTAGAFSREARLVIDWICEEYSTRLEVALRNPYLFSSIARAIEDLLEAERVYEETYSRKGRQDRFAALSEKREGLPDIPQEDMYRLLNSPDMEPTSLAYLVRWWDLASILRIQDMTRLYLVDGWTPVTLTMLVSLYRELLRQRLSKYVEEKKEEYEEKDVELPSSFARILATIRSRLPSRGGMEVASESIAEDAYPPCVMNALSGVGSGLRNFAITVFLSSFLSYARLFPSFSIFNREKRISLGEKEVSILNEEIIPRILEAGNRCRPPLFLDNEIEKYNVNYHLGFGMTSMPTPADFGKSKWYIPPNCEKVRQNGPSLCTPDSFCLSDFYIITDWEKFERLLETGRNRNNEILPVLSALRKYKNAEALSTRTGIEKKKVEAALEGLVLSKILAKKKISNPFKYYLRKKIQLKRK